VHHHSKRVVVDGDRRNRRARSPQNVVHRPTFGKSLVGQVGIVGDDVPFDFLHAVRHHLIGQIRQRFFRRPFALHGLLEGKLPVREIRIAAPHQHQIAAQTPARINRAVRLDRRADSVFRPQRPEGQRGREEFRIGGREKIAVRIFFIERLAGVRIRDQQPPIPLLRATRVERRLHARRESRYIRTRGGSARAPNGSAAKRARQQRE